MSSVNAMPSLAPPMEREMPQECPECGSDDIVENWRQGSADCRGCGLVLAERLLDLGTEWRTFTAEEGDDPNRAGPANNPLLEFEHGTGIGTGAKGGGALSISLNRAQNRNATSAADKVMMEVIQRIGRYRERLNLAKSVSDRALELFKRYQDHLTTKNVAGPGEAEKRVRTRTLREEEVNEIVASSLFIACRNQKVARSYKEICALTGVPKKNVGATVKKMEQALTDAKTTYVRGTDDFVTRFGNFLDLRREVINAADAVAHEMQNHEVLHGKTYTTLAAASIYIVTQLCKAEDKRSAKEIADVTGVAEVTIKSTYRLFYPYIEGVIPDELETAIKVSELPMP